MGITKTLDGLVAFHWGDKPNFKAFVAMNLSNRSAVVYFTNSENGLAIARNLVTPVVGDLSAVFNYLFTKYGYHHYDQSLSPKPSSTLITKNKEKTEPSEPKPMEFRTNKK